MENKQLKWISKQLFGTYFERDIEYAFSIISQVRFKDDSGKEILEQDVDWWSAISFPTDIGQWTFEFVQFEEEFILGRCDFNEKKIIVSNTLDSKDHIENTLLHELIHFFEYLFSYSSPTNYFNKALHEFLLMTYLEELKKIDSSIMEKINFDQNIGQTVNHTPFFVLKSLMIDYQKELMFGTIYGYGRDMSFNNQYQKLGYWDFINDES